MIRNNCKVQKRVEIRGLSCKIDVTLHDEESTLYFLPVGVIPKRIWQIFIKSIGICIGKSEKEMGTAR